MDMIFNILTFASAFLAVCCLLAAFHFLPKGELNKFQTKIAINYSERLRTGTSFAKFAFWGLPAAIFLFAHFWAGLLWLVANACAVVFSKRYQQSQPVAPAVG